MKLIMRLALLFYSIIALSVSIFFLLFIGGRLNDAFVQTVLVNFLYLPEYRIVLGICSIYLALMTVILYGVFSYYIKQNKIIAFNNPSGRVSVSLIALEDIIKRKILNLTEVKFVGIKIRAQARKIKVRIRLVLSSEVNIPEVTSKVQDLTTTKVRDVIGDINKPVDIAVYIGKIIPASKVKGKQQEDDDQIHQNNINIPFQGYRA